MSSSAAASATGGDNLSDALGSIGNTDSASATQTAASSGSVTASASASGSDSADASNTLTDAPNLGSSTESASTITGAPSLTSGNIPKLTNLPTLSGYYSYPPPTVPPTGGAPYMQKTNLPENFVFIVVGAVIAFVALIIIAWRILTSWSMNRRFRRFEGAGGAGKASYTPLADFKQKPAAASAHDMKDLGNLPKNFSSVPSLFFSPTAEVARHSMRPTTAKSDSQGHMPAGHYRDSSRT